MKRSKLLASRRHQPIPAEEAVLRFLAEQKASGQMGKDVECLKVLRSRKNPLKLKIELSDETYLVVHLAAETLQ